MVLDKERLGLDHWLRVIELRKALGLQKPLKQLFNGDSGGGDLWKCNYLDCVHHSGVHNTRRRPEKVGLSAESEARALQCDLTIHSSLAPVHTELVTERSHAAPGMSFFVVINSA